MITCQVCQHLELEGEVFCAECGARLAAAWAPSAGATSAPARPAAEQPASRPGGLRPGQVALVVAEGGARIVVTYEPESVLGRGGDAARGPDVDLNPVGAKDKGVSRQHARLHAGPAGLLVTDLGSTNGTQVNGRRLVPNEAAHLASGDELCLGRLVLVVTVAA